MLFCTHHAKPRHSTFTMNITTPLHIQALATRNRIRNMREHAGSAADARVKRSSVRVRTRSRRSARREEKGAHAASSATARPRRKRTQPKGSQPAETGEACRSACKMRGSSGILRAARARQRRRRQACFTGAEQEEDVGRRQFIRKPSSGSIQCHRCSSSICPLFRAPALTGHRLPVRGSLLPSRSASNKLPPGERML